MQSVYFDTVYHTAPRVEFDNGVHHPRLLISLDLGLSFGQIYATTFDRRRALVVSHPITNFVFVEYEDKVALYTNWELNTLLGSIMSEDDLKRLLGYNLQHAELCKALHRLIQHARLFDQIGSLLDRSAAGRIQVRQLPPMKTLEIAP